MEVHHPHHPTHKKKWSEYFLEFFMLFFAVTLGFFAENQREHLSEKHRESQYMASLLEDLEKDREELKEAKKFTLNQIAKIDTAMKIVSQNKWNNVTLPLLYKVNLKVSGNRPSTFIERTSSQLKTGEMHLIENKKVSTLISTYWQLIAAKAAFETATLEDNKRRVRNLAYTIFDQDNYIINENVISIDKNAKLMTYDIKTLKEYNNRLAHIKFDLKAYLVGYFYDKLEKTNIELSNEIKKEFK